MQLIKNAIYDSKPDDVTIYPTSVYVIKSCEEIEVVNKQAETTQIKFKCDVEVYNVTEYIFQKLESQTPSHVDTAIYDELDIAYQEGYQEGVDDI